MDGVEFIRHVAEDDLTGAVIVASALDAKLIHAVRAVSEGYGLQVLGVIEKPLTARRLGELLSSYRPRPRATTAATADATVAVTAAEAKRALADGRIGFLLRPAVDVATGAVAAAQAVPCWAEPDRGWIPSERFLGVLAREGLLADLGARAVALGCAQLRAHAEAGLDVAVSVDLAPDRLHDTDLADRVADVARAAGADPSRLTLEVDERALRHAPGHALGILTRLRVKGFGVALGRFGTGQLPVDQLRGLPLTEVEVAAGLVTGVTGDPARARLLEDVVEAARALDVAVVGAGCESEDDLRQLLSVGCDRVRGGFVAEPMAPDDLPAWVAAWDPDRLGAGWRG
jgi:EAL domain-containing protein (putative c-di-GMP-specific phosphodiesterase class I)